VNQATLNERERRVRAWHSSPAGALLREYEQRVMAEALDDVFGLHLLQIGAWGETGQLIQSARTQRRAVLGTDPASHPHVLSRASELPIASDSIDAVVLPHTLEFESDPYSVIREVERILTGEGQVVILGFAPLGMWGVRHRLASGGFPPGMARLISDRRLKEWLSVLGFEVGPARRYMHRMPWSPGAIAGNVMETEKRWLLPASCYLLKGRKRVYTVTPVRPRWRERRAIVGGLAEPTTRLRA
jgi:SAM-dependent methyltransferase